MERHFPQAPSRGPLTNAPSEELLSRARRGDEGALDRLLARYLPRLHRWAHRRVPVWARGGADTADYVQDTVLQSLRHVRTFEPTREGAFLGYLRRALVNRVRDQFRYAARRPAASALDDGFVDGGDSPLDQAIQDQDRRRYQAGLTRLRTDDRRAIVASIELGYSYDPCSLLILQHPVRIIVHRELMWRGEQQQVF